MSDDGSLKLGALVGRLTTLEVACARCERRGRLRLDKLIAEHGRRSRCPNSVRQTRPLAACRRGSIDFS
jgi:hypothetical protein